MQSSPQPHLEYRAPLLDHDSETRSTEPAPGITAPSPPYCRVPVPAWCCRCLSIVDIRIAGEHTYVSKIIEVSLRYGSAAGTVEDVDALTYLSSYLSQAVCGLEEKESGCLVLDPTAATGQGPWCRGARGILSLFLYDHTDSRDLMLFVQ